MQEQDERLGLYRASALKDTPAIIFCPVEHTYSLTRNYEFGQDRSRGSAATLRLQLIPVFLYIFPHTSATHFPGQMEWISDAHYAVE